MNFEYLQQISNMFRLKQASLIPNMIFTCDANLPSHCTKERSDELKKFSIQEIAQNVKNPINYDKEVQFVMVKRVLTSYLETETTKSNSIQLSQSCCTMFDRCELVKYQKNVIDTLINLSDPK